MPKNIERKNKINLDDKAKILVLMEHEENKKILQKILQGDYQILESKVNDFPEELFDLIVVDEEALIKHKRKFIELVKKEEIPKINLPVVLITNKTIKQLGEKVLSLIDEVIEVPSRKEYIRFTIEKLLKISGITLNLSEKIYRSLSQDTPIGVCILNDNKINYVNSTFLSILEKNKNDVLEKNILDIFVNEKIINFLEKSFDYHGKNDPNFKLQNLSKDRWIKATLSPVKFIDKELDLLIIMDISEHISARDSLTGLYNRKFIEEEMSRYNVKRQLPLSLIMADVNGLKMVNDTYGHEMGDKLLIRAAKLLEESCREEDLISRWGGDEFVVLLPGIDEKIVNKIYKRIKDNFREATLGVKDLPISIALGFAVKKTMDKDTQALLAEAEDKMYDNKRVESKSAKSNILQALLSALGAKSHETEDHVRRLKELAIKLGEKVGLSVSDLDRLSLLANLHDIGKTKIPAEILKKAGKLEESEWELIKKHPETGAYIASSSEDFSHLSEEIRSHHERWDGDGYPNGLEGEEIPYLARILSIVDAYDVMTAGRPYKDPLSKEEALKEIRDCAGSQFDPNLAEKFVEMISD
ncbi:HD domain-containing phosphohydrolase [Halonatronomonas betaini]|nr:HD domain-containing phosphohydrolase [Halonatronomonas betaini]